MGAKPGNIGRFKGPGGAALLALCAWLRLLALAAGASLPGEAGFTSVREDLPPLAVTASANPAVGISPVDVTFTADASGGVPPYTYAWVFGDGTGEAGPSVSHTYGPAGTYGVHVTATGGASQTAVAEVPVVVVPPLVVNAFARPASGSPPLTVTFGFTPSGGAAPFVADWDFGDGSAHSNLPSCQHTYASVGLYDAVLRLQDGSGQSFSQTFPIAVSLSPPVVRSVRKSSPPFQFVVTGANLQRGIRVFLGADTTPWPSVTWKSAAKIVIGGGAALKAKVLKGTPTLFTLVNPDGGVAVFRWAW